MDIDIGPFITDWGLRVVGALVVLVVGMTVAKALGAASAKAMTRGGLDATLVPFLSGMVHWLILAFVGIAVLNVFGINVTAFIAVLGAAGLAVGLAMQGTLTNFAAGVMLLLFRPFRVGDYIDAGGTAGTVVEVGIFSTILNTPDNVQVTAPNGSIYGQVIKNYSANATRRNDLVVGVSYSDDLAVAMGTITRVLAQDPRVLQDPAPTVAVGELADSSVNLVVRPWCTKEDYWALRFDLTRKMKEDLEAAGCTIPFPQSDVHLHQLPAGTTV